MTVLKYWDAAAGTYRTVSGPPGPTGPQGPAGGPTGPTGPTGPSAINPTITSITEITTTGGVATLPTVGGHVYLHNSAAALTLAPPALPVEALLVTIIDADGTAGTYAMSFQGTIGGVTNPVLLDFAYGSAAIQYHSGNWYRIR